MLEGSLREGSSRVENKTCRACDERCLIKGVRHHESIRHRGNKIPAKRNSSKSFPQLQPGMESMLSFPEG